MTTKQITASEYVVRDHFGEYVTDDDSRTPAYEEARRFASRDEAWAHATRETDRVMNVYVFADPAGNTEEYFARSWQSACRQYFRDFRTTDPDDEASPAGDWGYVSLWQEPADLAILVVADGKGGVKDWSLL